MRRLWTRAGLLAAAVALAGCTHDGGWDLDAGGAKGRAADDAIRVVPADRAAGVAPDDRLEVRVPSGRLERVRVVRVSDARPVAVPGRVSEDGLRWRPAPGTRLATAAAYRVEAVALDGHGRRSARHTTFTTAVPGQRFVAYAKPEHRSTVGTGMIVSLTFSHPVRDRAAVERAVRVTSRPAVEVAGHWFGDDRLDLRPRDFWRPGTEVAVDLRLRDVEGAPGVYGIQDKRIAFTVGRSQTAKVDAQRHTMEVRRDGELLATVPITAGAAKNTTYNGRMVVTELYEVTRMNGATVGFKDADGKGEYDIKDVPHAMRLTDSGTFLHGNYWERPAVFGSANVSHGCVGLRDVKGGSSDAPAGWFFDRTLVGDVVEVVNSADRTVDPANGLGGWNLDWTAWKAGSALR
ncbi:Ig-like domain-containing protein [Streptomyces sp. ODS05-4]|uniref:L,D-transpeptidase n=1 Tax=Streptomyces sp. ODS05-4 TaxID=2944939 RepID=UPI00210E10E2|nr:Ig-like domain-containing protein [Streptomyces sp. ODS05-4]